MSKEAEICALKKRERSERNSLLVLLCLMLALVGMICGTLFMIGYGLMLIATHGQDQEQLNEIYLKNLSEAAHLYLGDFDHHYPPANSWTDSMKPYIAQVGPWSIHSPYSPRGGYGFGMNIYLDGLDHDSLISPERTVLFFNSVENEPNAAGDKKTVELMLQSYSYSGLVTCDGTIYDYNQRQFHHVLWEP